METNMTKCLAGQVGFIGKENLQKYQRLLELGDVISKYSRMFDSTCGALTFAYLAVMQPAGKNDLVIDSYKAMSDECMRLVDGMTREINELTKEIEK